MQGISSGLPKQHVKYLETEEERFPFRVDFERDRADSAIPVNLVNIATGDLCDTTHMQTGFSGKGWAMIVYHARLGMCVASHEINNFHHSSIFGGQPVDFAGELVVQAGRVLKMMNKSGHYRPGRKEVCCTNITRHRVESLTFAHPLGV